MENIEEIERQIIEIVKAKFDIDGGANGVDFGAFDHVLILPRQERNNFIERMVKERKLVIFQSLNSRRITLPK